MHIDSPRRSRLKALRNLWREAFSDTEESLNDFILAAIREKRCRCAVENGMLAAALYWFECRCRGRRVAYLYAVATAEAFRSRGVCHALMEDTHRHLSAEGYEGAVLVPGSVSLFRFYETMGYRTCSRVREFCCKPEASQILLRQVDAAEYEKRRRQLLPEGGVVQEAENTDYLQTQAKLYTGPGFVLAAREEGAALIGLELLGDISAAPGIVHALGCEQGTFRTPGEDRDFAMYRPLGDSGLPAPCYFGLAFD